MKHIVVDSTCCINKEYAKQNNITIINLKSILDGVVRAEGFEEDWPEFFEAVKVSKDFPKTSQPSPDDFEETFNAILSKDKNAEIFVITLAESLSGTVNAATLAANNINPNKIFVIDSKQTVQSELLLVEELVDMIKNKMSTAKILENLMVARQKTMIQFVPASMEYLKRGGRISLLSATVASVLNIKPILQFKDGQLKCVKKALGLGQAISYMISCVPKNAKKVYISYIHDDIIVDKLIKRVKEQLHGVDLVPKKIGPVVGTHIGIGAIGLASIEEY